ncbi:LysR family transcriptional regulator [Sphingopyxis sp.]|uniref:LysR family transcriptional regulator n=1 Tax=Sphingopyxis sp. TaxID=1908224 RepID=UPI002585E310|nr:LysR family transcriptional regulator [Sphingopyxis sp.]
MKRLPRLDLNLLQIFDAIYTKGGVSAAASHLNLSQPAISHALAKLRAMLDDPLFIRQGNRLVPTGTARAVAEPIHAALRELVAALDGAGSFDPAQSTREFRIGIRLAGEMSRFPALASRVLAEAPHVRLTSTAFRRRDLVAALANGDLDVAIDVDLPVEDRLCREPLGVEPLLVAARIGNDRIAEALDLDRYLALDHVFATPRPHGPGIEDIALARLGLQRRVAVRCQHAITAWQIVAKTDMLCTLPRSHVRMLQDIWPMQLFDLPIAVAQSSSYLYWHRAVQADAGLAWLRAIILEVMREE